MQGKTAIANILKQEGVDVVSCFPNNALIDAAAAAGIRPIISRMERTAVNMADSRGAHVENIPQADQIAPALERAKQISATGQPVALEIITREEPIFSRYY